MRNNYLKQIFLYYLGFLLILLPLLGYAQSFGTSIERNVSAASSAGTGASRDIRSFGTAPMNRSLPVDTGQAATSVGMMGSGMESSFYYSIHVIGEVTRPGTYRVLPSDRVTDALRYAGGTISNGSQRYVEIRRNGSITRLDLFKYKYNGDLSQNPYVMENDAVFVPLKKGEFEIEGPVNRPGIYEISDSITLKEAVQYAGGFATGYSLKDPIRVVRFNKEEKKEVIVVEGSQTDLSSFRIKKGDIVIVPHMLLSKKTFDYNINRIPGDNIFYPTINNNVYVIGAVAQAGPYPFQPSFNYQNYVGLAGPTNLSSLRRIKVIRSDGKTVALRKVKEINPGDTIVVPQKALTVTNTLTWFNTIISTTLTTILLYDNLKDR